MPKLISGYIRGQIAKYLGPQVLDATLIKVTPGIRAPDAQAAGTNPSEASYEAKGWVAAFEGGQIDGTLVRADDRDIALLGGTIDGDQVPEVGDKIVIEGGTYRIVGGRDGKGVRRDADGAKFTCHGRKVPGA